MLKKVIYASIGIAAMALGAVGTVVPGLPATPFFLLALLCFTKSSEKLNCWFRGTGLYAKYVKEYEYDRSMTRKQKLIIQAAAGLMMFISFLLIGNMAVRLLLIAAFILHNYVFIFVIKTRQAGRTETTTKG
ncbi:YbaN family protein [Lacrimispora sp.]|uniref:YbaN family protein n=1 Tax=Lacrimispora sp. TaxID=2719234 RepID=UPI0028636E45|nr:YbaN family protein [Lacrimispora sp.]MDR7811063.1 YbaN family protein [Lacrimispora sp.]